MTGIPVRNDGVGSQNRRGYPVENDGVYISKSRVRTKELELRRADLALAADGQPNPPAKSEVIKMAEKSVKVQKQCSRCGEWKGRSEFYRGKERRDGLAYWCKECADKATNKSRRRRAAKRAVSLQADAGS